MIASIDLAPKGGSFKGQLLRMRKLTIAPGGVVPWHEHSERPANIYIISGTIKENRANCLVPIVHKPGDVAVEFGKGFAHWWKNTGTEPVVLISADIFKDKMKDFAHDVTRPLGLTPASPTGPAHVTLATPGRVSRSAAEVLSTLETDMIRRNFNIAALGLATSVLGTHVPQALASKSNGIIRSKSIYGMTETIGRITADVEKKGIKLFGVIDQAKLAKEAGVELRPSSLIVFGNPPLGTLFLTARAEAGLDWPVRLLVFEDEKGQVWTAYTDFHWIAQRHDIRNRGPQFRKATEVITSIVSSTMA